MRTNKLRPKVIVQHLILDPSAFICCYNNMFILQPDCRGVAPVQPKQH